MVILRPWWWLLVAMLAAGTVRAHENHAGHAQSGRGAAASGELGASAAFDAQGRLWAVTKSGGHVMLVRSDDAGRTWQRPVQVNPKPEGIGADGDSRPKVATGPGGEVYVSWTRPLSKPYTGEIRFARSLDAGRSFSPPLTVHADRQEITHRFDALAVARDGRVLVAWIDKRDQEIAKGRRMAYRGAAVYFAVSDDRGASFRADHKLADYSCECCRIALAERPDGSMLALWRHVFEPNVRDHAIARFHLDGRVEPLRRATFDDWKIDACPHHGPSLALDRAGGLHAVWFTQAAGREGIHYGRLVDGAVEGTRRVGGDAAEHADLAVDADRIAIAWKEFDGTRTRLRALRSDDGGRRWREVGLSATDGPSDQPRVLLRNGRFSVFWNTRIEPLSVVALP
jgi:hypothetical protein